IAHTHLYQRHHPPRQKTPPAIPCKSSTAPAAEQAPDNAVAWAHAATSHTAPKKYGEKTPPKWPSACTKQPKRSTPKPSWWAETKKPSPTCGRIWGHAN